MTIWSDLISTALVGTDRRPVPSPQPDSPLSAPLAAAPTGPPPRRLLDVAAVLTLARRAGSAPQRGVVLPVPAPLETTPQVIPAAAARLTAMLTDRPRGQQGLAQRAALLTEWLTLAATYQLRVPPAVLPALLDEARVRVDWRPLVRSAAGLRGPWLAAQHPNWTWLAASSASASTVDAEAQWSEGTSSQRLAYLSGLRRRDPDAARGLLVQAWPDEPPANRAELLLILEAGLASADEELCEQALDDRRKEVRTVAASLLAVLAGSAYQQRMADRALACVAVNPAGELVVTPPDECDKAMRRDGIEPKPPQSTGERAWWFEQIVSRTPLSAWTDIDGDVSTLLRRPVDEGWHKVLHRAWAQATVDQHDPTWAAAFARVDSPAMSRVPAAAAALTQAVYRQLAPADAENIAIAMLDADDPYVEHLLAVCARPFTDHLVAAVLARLERFFDHRPGPLLATLVTAAAMGFPPTIAPAATALAKRYRDRFGDEVHAPFYDRLAQTLTFRHEMHQEFA